MFKSDFKVKNRVLWRDWLICEITRVARENKKEIPRGQRKRKIVIWNLKTRDSLQVVSFEISDRKIFGLKMLWWQSSVEDINRTALGVENLFRFQISSNSFSLPLTPFYSFLYSRATRDFIN